MSLSRRDLLKSTLTATGSALAGATFLNRAIAASCGLTPAQTEGPFYPEKDQLDTDTDLTFVKDRTQRALGQVIYIQGRILDPKCKPLPNALVEIWQACASGRYNHSADPNVGAPLDPNFQYWGKAVTDAQGRYLFKTIKPGAYPADVDWDRPPHIHFKVQRLGYHELTTQLYFAGEALNEKDKILLDLKPSSRASVITQLRAVDPPLELGAQIGDFDITLRKA